MSFVFDGIGEETYHAIADTLKALERGYNQLRDQSLDLLQLLGKADASGSIPRYHETIANDLRVYKVSDYVNARLNSTPQMTRDSEEYAKGRMVPVHVQYAALLEIIAKNKARAEAIGTILRNLTELLIMNSLIAPPSSGGMRIFIGHGRSLQWRVLKDFLRDSLGLEHDEFNRISPAGLSNQQRLDDMMKECGFAFLVMTAEDESADGQLHARENVIHEAGLFQGSKGWKKAIIVLEEGCKEFSNINGLGQIRFPKGRINNCFEEIRQVLQREKII